MDEKGSFSHLEGNSKETTVPHDDAARHGDRALSIIGDERVSLTEEDVRLHRRFSLLHSTDLGIEQTH